MLTLLRNKSRYFVAILFFLLCASMPARAGGPPEPSIFSNSLAVMLIIVMFILLIIIGVLGYVLVGAADFRARRKKSTPSAGTNTAAFLLFFLFIPAGSLLAQDAESVKAAAPATIGGMAAWVFYLAIVIIFLELVVIITMLINIRFLLAVNKKEPLPEEDHIKVSLFKTWWDKINKFRPVSQEQDLDLGHEYDGIRELDNRLPPWWLYGFYLTIIFAFVYLWRFHVSHTGPSSQQEYEQSVAKADLRIKEYLKSKGESVDENTVVMLSAPDELAEGKAIFMKSCASCHLESGGGSVGPNLTDDYWMHGNDIKSVFKTIRYGINAMPQWQNSYSNKQLAQVSSYVKSLRGTNPPNAKAPQGTEIKETVTTGDSTITHIPATSENK